MHPLSGVYAKIERSRNHFDVLNSEINAFLSRNPYEVVHKFDANERIYSFRAKQREDVPLIIRVLLGETLTQLRSALDHLAWQLALLNGSTPPFSTEFPVFKNSSDYKSRRIRKIGALPISAQAIIDALQPYTSTNPTDNGLWILHRLANQDKH